MQMQEVIKHAVKAEVKEILEQKMKEVELQMSEAEQKLDAAKQEADAAKQEADVLKKLIQILLNEERYDDLKRITMDEGYLKKMMTVYNIGLDEK